jgi:PAS domain S-box-containing protein
MSEQGTLKEKGQPQKGEKDLIKIIDSLQDRIYDLIEKNDKGREQKPKKVIDDKQLFFSILDNLPAFVYLQAPDHSIKYANSYFKKVFGEPGSRPCYNLLCNRNEPCEVCQTFQVFDDKQHKEWEWESQTGKIYRIYDYPFYDIDGNLLVLELGVDITDLKKAEEARYLLASIVRSSTDVILSKDLNGIITSWNKAAESLYGYSADEAVGKLLNIIVPDEYMAEANEILNKVREGSVVENMETIRKHKNGRLINVSVTLSPVFDANGKIIGTSSIVKDITERKKIEESLKISHFTIEHAADMIFWVDRQGNLINVNNAAIDSLGYARDELLSMKTFDISSIHTKENWPFHWKELKEKGSLTIEIGLKAKDGHYVPVEISANYLFFDGKEYNCAIARDITERKIAEKQIRDSRAESELYLDLMSHDINNLNQIGIGFLEIAIETMSLDDNGKKLLSTPLEALRSSTRLIENVRKLQSVKEGGLKSHIINITKMVEDVVKKYSGMTDRDIKINFYPGSECNVIANALLEDVFSNLIGNSIKHSEGSLTIDVRITNELEGDKSNCIVIVEDNGPGIQDEIKSKLFTRYQRGDTKASGRGLGLYLVKSLIDDFKGSIRVEDRIKGDSTKGSRFIVKLPCV